METIDFSGNSLSTILPDGTNAEINLIGVPSKKKKKPKTMPEQVYRSARKMAQIFSPNDFLDLSPSDSSPEASKTATTPTSDNLSANHKITVETVDETIDDDGLVIETGVPVPSTPDVVRPDPSDNSTPSLMAEQIARIISESLKDIDSRNITRSINVQTTLQKDIAKQFEVYS